jgi:DNA-binding transcriptional LysR family regulator
MKVEFMNAPHRVQTPLLELDLLKTLVAISEMGNFSAASEVVFRTPSAVSMQVKRIEELLGHQIFKRSARSVTPTEDGEMLIAHARRVLALNRDIVARFIVPEVSGVVRVGALDYAVEEFLPVVLRRFSETHPGITVDVVVENSKPLEGKIRQGQLDIAIITCDANKSARKDVEILYREKMAWAGLRGGVAAEQDPLPVSVWEEDCVWRIAGLQSLEMQGRDYRITFKSAYVSGMKAAILADLVVAPLPVSICEGPIIALGSEYNLPEMSDCALGMLISKDATAPVEAVADHLRATFADR